MLQKPRSLRRKISSRFDFNKSVYASSRSIGFNEFHLSSQNWDLKFFPFSRRVIETARRQSITGHFNYLSGSKLLRRWTPLDLTEAWPLIRLRISLSSDFSINYPGIDINLVINFILRQVKWFISNNRNGSLIWISWALRKLCRNSFSGSSFRLVVINSLDNEFLSTLSCYFENPAKTFPKLSTTCSKWRHHKPSLVNFFIHRLFSLGVIACRPIQDARETFIHACSVVLLFKY